MRVIHPTARLEYPTNTGDCLDMIGNIERAGRTCYKSEREFTDATAAAFCEMLIERGHESVIEHTFATVRFIFNRGGSHEVVRHRLASYSQESTRYCNYAKEKFGSEITVQHPGPVVAKIDKALQTWFTAMEYAEFFYFKILGELIEGGMSAKEAPQFARGVLPIDLKTELVMSANFREWRHFFNLRTADAAHPQLRQVTRPLLVTFRKCFPVVFDDVGQLC